jgi:hypothetical protein
MNRLGHEDSVLLARDTKESNRLHKSWRRTKFYKELNKALTGEQTSIDDSGEDSDAAEEPNLPFEMSNAQDSTGLIIQQPEGSHMGHHQPSMQQSAPGPQLTPLPPDCWQLLETYSTYTQCWFPISEKLDVLKLSYSYPSDGLMLSPDMPDSGNHAEMWSIFALSSNQNTPSINRMSQGNLDVADSRMLYATAQSLIPTELGQFCLGHVKALLNLALVNLRSSLHNAAWILVGAASRILPILEGPLKTSSPRYKHVMASCYLLDNLLALLLNRRPYYNKSDLERAGSIEEDGLEEWQPWVGELETRTAQQSRLPTLALSSFNRLVDLVDILVTMGRHPNARTDGMERLAHWKSALSPKFDYVRSDSTTIPLTPPAVLLQLTNFATALALSPSQVWLQRTLEMLEMCQEQLEPTKLPSAIICLLESIRKSSKSLPLDQVMQAQIDKVITSFAVAPAVEYSGAVQAIPNDLASRYTGERISQARTTQIYPQLFPRRVGKPNPARHPQQHDSTSLLESLLPDMNPGQQLQISQPTTFSPIPVENDFTSPALDAYDPSVSGDLESFFDELASLHGAKKLQNQPQFMQNLGFAPEVSMADLLATQSGQYTAMDPSAFAAEDEAEPLQFPLSDYYDAG